MSQTTNVSNTQNPFSAPVPGALTNDRMKFPTIEYGAFKTPATWVPKLTKADFEDALANFKLGFHFWDKEAGEIRENGKRGQKIAIPTPFTFVLLEVYSKLSGKVETGPKQYINYYSNKVKDTRTEPFGLFIKGGDGKAIGRGFYQGKQSKQDLPKLIDKTGKVPPYVLPDGVSFTQVFVIYWVEGDRILNLDLSTMVSREIKRAISNAERSTGRNSDPEKIMLFGLADKGHLWGFQLQTYRRAEKDGNDYKSGDLFFVPTFVAGMVMTEGPNANPDLYNKCLAMQTDIRADYAQILERRKQYGDSADVETNDQGDHDSQFDRKFDQAQGYQNRPADDYSFPTSERPQGGTQGGTQAVTQPDPYSADDLPF